MHATTCLTLAILGLAASSALAGGHSRYSGSSRHYAKQTSGCQPPPTYQPVCQPQPVCAPSGYWRTSTSRVWVPGQWVPKYSQYTGRTQTWISGHYETRRIRTWVSTSPPPPRQYCQR